MMPLLVIDTETGGFDPLTCALLEIAAIATDAGGRVVARHHNLISPVGEVEAQAVAVNGYNEAEWRFALAERDAITDLMGFLAEHPTELVVGHNIGFDVGFIEQHAFRRGLDVELMLRRRVDTGKVFDARKLGIKTKRVGGSASLSSVAKALGVTEPQKHRAMETARCSWSASAGTGWRWRLGRRAW